MTRLTLVAVELLHINFVKLACIATSFREAPLSTYLPYTTQRCTYVRPPSPRDSQASCSRGGRVCRWASACGLVSGQWCRRWCWSGLGWLCPDAHSDSPGKNHTYTEHRQKAEWGRKEGGRERECQTQLEPDIGKRVRLQHSCTQFLLSFSLQSLASTSNMQIVSEAWYMLSGHVILTIQV